ncbi:MAG: polyprenyl synthetase family protein [Dehalococcoidales bacterium]|nr:polyprenyl synthetase family protein [Dehalococcoidales bacterium]
MQLNEIYQSIQQDLTRVEEIIISVTQADLSWLPETLARDLKTSGKLETLLTHSLTSSGKKIRPALTLLVGKIYNGNIDQLLAVAAAIEILHTATLVHDDAIDHADVRRGKATINKIWDDDKAILLGDYLIAKSVELTATTQNTRVIQNLVQTIMTICTGELAQSFDAFNPKQTRQHYLHRIFCKTGALLSLATESGAILSEAPEKAVKALREYGYNLGIAFQIIDDIMDFTSTEEEMGKPVGSDLAQGTLTLPAMLLLERYPDNNPIREIFQNRNPTENIKRAIELVRNSAIIPDCYHLASDYSAKACQSLNLLPQNTNRQSLTTLAQYVIERKK